MVVSSSGVKYNWAVVGHNQEHLVMHCWTILICLYLLHWLAPLSRSKKVMVWDQRGGAGPFCAEFYMFSNLASSHSAGTFDWSLWIAHANDEWSTSIYPLSVTARMFPLHSTVCFQLHISDRTSQKMFPCLPKYFHASLALPWMFSKAATSMATRRQELRTWHRGGGCDNAPVKKRERGTSGGSVVGSGDLWGYEIHPDMRTEKSFHFTNGRNGWQMSLPVFSDVSDGSF